MCFPLTCYLCNWSVSLLGSEQAWDSGPLIWSLQESRALQQSGSISLKVKETCLSEWKITFPRLHFSFSSKYALAAPLLKGNNDSTFLLHSPFCFWVSTPLMLWGEDLWASLIHTLAGAGSVGLSYLCSPLTGRNWLLDALHWSKWKWTQGEYNTIAVPAGSRPKQHLAQCCPQGQNSQVELWRLNRDAASPLPIPPLPKTFLRNIYQTLVSREISLAFNSDKAQSRCFWVFFLKGFDLEVGIKLYIETICCTKPLFFAYRSNSFSLLKL